MKQFIKNTFTPGQAGKARLLCLLFVIAAAAGNILHAQTVKAYKDGALVPGSPFNAASWAYKAVPANTDGLRDADSIVVTGALNPTKLAGLRNALKNTIEQAGSNDKLRVVDLSGVTLTTTGNWNLTDGRGIRGLFLNCTALTKVIMPTARSTYAISFENTFSGCVALNYSEGINLNGFTKVQNLTNTFYNCRQLTSVRLGSVPTANITDAFTNANPNMLKYLPAAKTSVPQAWLDAGYTNFIKGTSDTPSIPVAYGDMVLVDKWTDAESTEHIAPYLCPLPFTVPAGSTISYTRDFTGQLDSWQSIVLPFEAVSINGGLTADLCGLGDYRVARYGSADDEGRLTFHEAAVIAAHKPHLVMFFAHKIPNPASVRFASADTGFTVPAILAELTDPGTSGNFFYTGTMIGSKDEAYYLSGADTFAKSNTQTGAVGSESQPFRAYFAPKTTSTLDALTIVPPDNNPVVIATWTADGRTETYCAIDWTYGVIPVDLSAATKIVATGTWSMQQIYGLREAVHNGYEYQDVRENTSLFTVDMSGMAFFELSSDATFDLSELFRNCTQLTTVSFPESNTFKVNLDATFMNCKNLTTVNNLDKLKDVYYLFDTFNGCEALKSIALPTANGDNAVVFQNTFSGCSSLETIENLEKFKNVIDFQGTFSGCSSLTNIQLPSEGTIYANPISFSNAFSGCSNLERIENLEKFDNVSSFQSTFSGCSSLTDITLPLGTKYNTEMPFDSAFENCWALRNIDNLKEFDKIYDLQYTFAGCRQLTSVQLGVNPSAGEVFINEGTFSETNPNMLKYLPTGSTVLPLWSDYTNFIIQDAAGGGYTAVGDIVLVDNNGTFIAPYHCPVAFKLKAGNTARYTRRFTDKLDSWQTIILPFEATIDNAANVVADLCGTGDYALAKYVSGDASGNLSFQYTDRLHANTPHIIRLPSANFPAADPVQFISEPGITIPATPASLTASGTSGNFTYTGTLLGTTDEAYYVDGANNDTFTKDNAQTAALGSESQPFRAYFMPSTAGVEALTITAVVADDPSCSHVSGVPVSITVFLEGPLQANGIMANYLQEPDDWENSLLSEPVLPQQNPYNVKEKGSTDTYVNCADINSPDKMGQITDWLWVEIWEATYDADEYTFSYTIHEEQALLLRPNGEVVDVNGNVPVFEERSTPVYIVVKHRNHMPVISKSITQFNLAAGEIAYDFTQAKSILEVYDEDVALIDKHRNGNWCMVAGDMSYKGTISISDHSIVVQQMNNEDDYFSSDFNMDGWVSIVDFNVVAGRLGGLFKSSYQHFK